MTRNQRQKITAALAETQGLIAKEMAYSEDLRNVERLDRLTGHAAKLQGWLDTDADMNAILGLDKIK